MDRMSSESSILVVVATYNERENLEAIVSRIKELPIKCDVLIVDDNSPDGTGSVANTLAKQNSHIHVLHRPDKKGLASALIAGFRWAISKQCSKVVNIDADLSHNPSDIAGLLALSEHADVVIGSRYINGVRVMNWRPKRLLLSLCAGQYVRLLTRMPIHDPTSGFRCFSCRALKFLDAAPIYSKGYFYHVESLYRMWRKGFQIEEYPIVFHDRINGETKLSAQIVLEAALRCLFLRFDPCSKTKSIGKSP
jgi:dolichol-phosphate mannosyltransferase